MIKILIEIELIRFLFFFTVHLRLFGKKISMSFENWYPAWLWLTEPWKLTPFRFWCPSPSNLNFYTVGSIGLIGFQQVNWYQRNARLLIVMTWAKTVSFLSSRHSYILQLLGPGWGNVDNNPAGLEAACLGGLKPPTHYRQEKVDNNKNRKVSVTAF